MLSPDGKTLLWTVDKPHYGNLGVINLRTRDAVTVNVPGRVYDVAISPDGRYAATAGSEQVIRVWDLQTVQHAESYTGHTGEIKAVAFSPDGQFIASASPDYSIRIWNRRTRQQTQLHRPTNNNVPDLCFSADGARLLYANSSNGAVVYDIRQQRKTETLRPNTNLYVNPRRVVALPDARGMVFANNAGGIYVWRLQDQPAASTAPDFGPIAANFSLAPAPVVAPKLAPKTMEVTEAPSVDFEVATWALQLGWQIEAQRADGRTVRISKADDAPLDPFSITGLSMLADPQEATDAQLRQLADLESLQRIAFSQSLTDNCAERLPVLAHVTQISFLDCSKITERTIARINTWPKLNAVHFTRGQTAGPVITKLNNPSVTVVTCAGIHLDHEGVAAIVRRLPQLAGLHFRDAPITDDCLEPLRALGSLKALSLVNTSITSEGLKTVAKLEGLKQLYLNKAKIDGSSLNTISNLQLEELVVDGVPLNEECLPVLAGFKKLQMLVIDRTGLSPQNVQWLKERLPHCRVLGNPAIAEAPRPRHPNAMR